MKRRTIREEEYRTRIISPEKYLGDRCPTLAEVVFFDVPFVDEETDIKLLKEANEKFNRIYGNSLRDRPEIMHYWGPILSECTIITP